MKDRKKRKREGLEKKEVNLLRNTINKLCSGGAFADQRSTLPAVFVKTTPKDGNHGGLGWLRIHMARALRERGELGSRCPRAVPRPITVPQSHVTKRLTIPKSTEFGSGTQPPLLSGYLLDT